VHALRGGPFDLKTHAETGLSTPLVSLMSALAKKQIKTKAFFSAIYVFLVWGRRLQSLLFSPIHVNMNHEHDNVCQHHDVKVSRFSPVSSSKLEPRSLLGIFRRAIQEALLKTLNGSVLHYTFIRALSHGVKQSDARRIVDGRATPSHGGVRIWFYRETFKRKKGNSACLKHA